LIQENIAVAAAEKQFRTNKTLSLDIYKKFGDYLQSKYHSEEEINQNEDKEFDSIFLLGLIQAQESLNKKDSIILINGRIAKKTN
jgi:hypothetical protein